MALIYWWEKIWVAHSCLERLLEFWSIFHDFWCCKILSGFSGHHVQSFRCFHYSWMPCVGTHRDGFRLVITLAETILQYLSNVNDIGLQFFPGACLIVAQWCFFLEPLPIHLTCGSEQCQASPLLFCSQPFVLEHQLSYFQPLVRLISKSSINFSSESCNIHHERFPDLLKTILCYLVWHVLVLNSSHISFCSHTWDLVSSAVRQRWMDGIAQLSVEISWLNPSYPRNSWL